MNEQLQEKLLEIVTKIESSTESAWGFITEQTPDVVEQLLLWHGVYSFVLFCVLLIMCATLLLISFKIKKWADAEIKEKEPYDPIWFYVAWILPTGGSLSLFVINIFENFDWLQIWLAPKIWLLEYIQTMVK